MYSILTRDLENNIYTIILQLITVFRYIYIKRVVVLRSLFQHFGLCVCICNSSSSWFNIIVLLEFYTSNQLK